MIRFENTCVSPMGLESALRGMRNPYDSWEKSDTRIGSVNGSCVIRVEIGPEDERLCRALIRAGVEHATFLRMIVCWTDITAPRLWWTEMDRYRIGKEQVSCSTMHTILKRPLMEEDFGLRVPGDVIAALNRYRDAALAARSNAERELYWRYLIDNLPQSYHQKRTVMLSYQTIRKICRERKGHKLSEWADFIGWAKELPNSWMLFEEGEHECKS